MACKIMAKFVNPQQTEAQTKKSDLDFLHINFEKDDQIILQENVIDKKIDLYLIEDDKILGNTLKKFLEKNLNIEVHYFSHPSECLSFITGPQKNFLADNLNLIVTDILFEECGVDGLYLIDLLKERGDFLPAIVMTGFASIESAINATKKGVFHYLTKPFEISSLANLICELLVSKAQLSENQIRKKMIERTVKNLETECQNLITAPEEDDIFCSMIGRSPVMKDLFEKIKKVAASDSTVLITGASGTGKELVADAIHSLSLRSGKPFISVNCGAIPSELLESELFGHVKGAFTGALSDRRGRFELAHQGTLFLDEIGDMPLLLQVKILRAIQSKRIEKVGGSDSISVNVRIITATHRDLEKAVKEGNFREDLYYRLNVIPLRVPSLHDRIEDISLLISYFLNKFVSADGRNRIRFASETIDLLKAHDWPGNVRELENLIERMVILRGGSVVRPSDLPSKFLDKKTVKEMSFISKNFLQLPDDGIDLKNFLIDLEDSLITQALKKTQNNKNQASKLLKMNRTTLIEKLKKKNTFSDLELG